VITYPFETFACLLPWSPLLVVFGKRSFRESLGHARPLVAFVLVAIALTYPTVLFATYARGRYYMPLYPCLAALIGIVIDRCAAATPNSSSRRDWTRFLYIVGAGSALAGVAAAVWTVQPLEKLAPFRPTPFIAAVLALSGAVTCGVLMWNARQADSSRSQWGLLSFCAFIGLFYTGVVLNATRAAWNDPAPLVAAARTALPANTPLVSFGPLDHRFCYFYYDPITELKWPQTLEDVPASLPATRKNASSWDAGEPIRFCQEDYPWNGKRSHAFAANGESLLIRSPK
jgi:hypothetical protein